MDYYLLYFKHVDDSYFDSITIEANTKETNEFVLNEVKGNAFYVVKICAGTNSITHPERVWKGKMSNEERVFLPEASCSQVLVGEPGGELSAGMVVGAVCAVLFLLLAVLGIILWR